MSPLNRRDFCLTAAARLLVSPLLPPGGAAASKVASPLVLRPGVPVVLAHDAPAPLRRAVEDLRRDLQAVLGKASPLVAAVPAGGTAAIRSAALVLGLVEADGAKANHRPQRHEPAMERAANALACLVSQQRRFVQCLEARRPRGAAGRFVRNRAPS